MAQEFKITRSMGSKIVALIEEQYGNLDAVMVEGHPLAGLARRLVKADVVGGGRRELPGQVALPLGGEPERWEAPVPPSSGGDAGSSHPMARLMPTRAPNVSESVARDQVTRETAATVRRDPRRFQAAPEGVGGAMVGERYADPKAYQSVGEMLTTAKGRAMRNHGVAAGTVPSEWD
jgi:hypothetical protein